MSYIPVPLQVSPTVTHTLYVRRHQSRGKAQVSDDSDSDEHPAVFAANIPRDATVDNVKDICKALGEVILISFEYQGDNHGLFRLADEGAVDRFLAKARKFVSSGKKSVGWTVYGPRGVNAYLARHMAEFPPESDIQENVDAFMEEFAAEEAIQRKEMASHSGQADEDGFIAVGKRRIETPSTTAIDPPKKKKKSQEKQDFYRFQLRERRKQEVSELLRKYDEDKAKVEEMKQRKKFRPY